MTGSPWSMTVYREALRLRSNERLGAKAISRRIGVPHSTVFRWINPDAAERQRARARTLKETYRGTCENCGQPTTGCDGPGSARRLCHHCAPRDPERVAKQTKWPRALILERIREWADLHGEPPASLDWNPWKARQMHDEPRARRFEDAGGYWPNFTTVVERFGTWNTAITAAGFEARQPNGGGGNRLRCRDQSAPGDERDKEAA